MGYKKMILKGSQTCDYVCVKKGYIINEDFESVNSEPKIWDENMLFLAKFNNDLTAGSSALLDSIKSYQIYRQNIDDNYEVLLGDIPNDKKYMIDYLACSNAKYSYHLAPKLEMSGSGAKLSQIETDTIEPVWDYWTLILAEETEQKNVYYLYKMFKFALNVENGDMSNNTPFSISQNFTSYPILQKGHSNYWSGSLSALCGYTSCTDDCYVQTPKILNELKALTTDMHKKFLKDTYGNVWEVELSAPINISQYCNSIQDVKSVKISWVEVGDSSGASVIDNPNTLTTQWVLTEDGYAKPYVEYRWDDTKKWDDGLIWTENLPIK